jgi:hypothetical protein
LDLLPRFLSDFFAFFAAFFSELLPACAEEDPMLADPEVPTPGWRSGALAGGAEGDLVDSNALPRSVIVAVPALCLKRE